MVGGIGPAVITILEAIYAAIKFIFYLIKRIHYIPRVVKSNIYQLFEMNQIWIFWGTFALEGFVAIFAPGPNSREDRDRQIAATRVLDYMGAGALLDEIRTVVTDDKTLRKYASDVSQSDREMNLLAIGGPNVNSISESVLDQTDYTLYTINPDEGVIESIVNDGSWSPDENEDGEIVRDYTLITRVKSPYNDEKDAVVVAGITGWGTEAGLKLLRNRKALKYMRKQGGDHFQVIGTVDIDSDGYGHQPCLVDHHPNDEIKETTISEIDYSDSD